MRAVGAIPLLLPVASLAAPPASDNRASAEAIPTFPATIQGTTVEATVERLDPQGSECGRVESTLWYRIDQAPDGTVALSLQGAGFSPVLRVYDLLRNGTDELRCDSAGAVAAATVAFSTERGAPISSSSASGPEPRTRRSRSRPRCSCRRRTTR